MTANVSVEIDACQGQRPHQKVKSE